MEAVAHAAPLLQPYALLFAVAASQSAELAGDVEGCRSAVASIAKAGSEIEAAIARCRLGRVLVQQGEALQARDCLAQAEAVRAAQGLGPGAPLHFHCGELQARLESTE